MSSFIDKLEIIEARYEELVTMMARPEISVDYERVQSLGKELSKISDTVALYRTYRKLLEQQSEIDAMLRSGEDPDFAALAHEELGIIAQQLIDVENDLKVAILPKDTNVDRNVIVEIRKGTGGREAALFAGDLYRMYNRYAQVRGWSVEVLDSNPSELAGFNEIVLAIKGAGAFGRLKFERGVHRVQRVPTTETSGRLHTSTATLVVLPEADEIEVKLNPDDLRIDVFHAGGHGGQNVNKVASAIRVVHIPTGTVAVCQDERSQFKNKQKALHILRARLFEIEQQRKEQEVSQSRKTQVGTGERSEKIRTYNYPQDRVTDHRLEGSIYGIQKFLDGGMDELIDALITDEQVRMLDEASIS